MNPIYVSDLVSRLELLVKQTRSILKDQLDGKSMNVDETIDLYRDTRRAYQLACRLEDDTMRKEEK